MANITTGKTEFQKRTIALACAEQRVKVRLTVRLTVRPTVRPTVEPTTEREPFNQKYLDLVEACKEKSRAKPGKVIIAGGDGVSLVTMNGQT